MTEFEVVELQPQQAAAFHATVPMEEVPRVFDRGFPLVVETITRQGLGMAGPPFGYYPRMPDGTVEVYAGFPTTGAVEADGEVVPLELPGGRAVTGVHAGSYDDLERTYAELAEWARDQGLELAEGMWESYLTEPTPNSDPADMRTQVTWPIR